MPTRQLARRLVVASRRPPLTVFGHHHRTHRLVLYANWGCSNPAACRSSAYSSKVNVPPLSVFTNMLMANRAPSQGPVRSRLHHHVADGDPPARHERLEHLGEQLAVVPPRMLVANGAYPGEVGPAGKFVDVEIARHERHAPANSVPASRCRACSMASGRSKIVAVAVGHGAQKGQRPRARCPAHVQQMRGIWAGRAGPPDRRPSVPKSCASRR